MTTLTNEQLQQIAITFGLSFINPPKDTLPVRDGIVSKDSLVWWRGEDGPELVKAEDDWHNIEGFPKAYQLREPVVIKVVYRDGE